MMNQRMAGRRPQVVEGGWLGQVIDQGVKVRFGRNRNGAEVGIGAPREKVSRRYGIAAEKCRQWTLPRVSSSRVWSLGRGGVQNAAGGVQIECSGSVGSGLHRLELQELHRNASDAWWRKPWN